MINLIAMILATSAIITGLIFLGILILIIIQAQMEHEVHQLMEAGKNDEDK